MKPSLIMLQTLLLASITALHAAEKAAKPKPDQLAGIDPSTFNADGTLRAGHEWMRQKPALRAPREK